jgi:hypothetical protein
MEQKRTGANYVIESGGTPANADFSTAATTVLINNATTLKVRDNIALGDAGSRYLRVRVSAAP